MEGDGHALQALFQRLNRYLSLSQGQRALIEGLFHGAQTVTRETALVEQGQRYQQPGLLADGWAVQYKSLPDGRRQVIDLLLPGTFFGMQAVVFETADHSIATLTDSTISWFGADRLADLVRRDPVLGMAIAWDRTAEESVLMERLVSLGQRSARERLAHVLVEFWHRLELRGLGEAMQLPFPVSQYLVADLLGVTGVHVNRTLRSMKADGLIDYDRSRVHLIDLEALKHLADFETGYLHTEPMPGHTKRITEKFSR